MTRSLCGGCRVVMEGPPNYIVSASGQFIMLRSTYVMFTRCCDWDMTLA